MNEYSWHESQRRLARGVSSLHQAPKQRRRKKKKKKKKRERAREGGKGREKRGGIADRHTL